MRLAWLLVWLPLSAHADLYRWIDPVSGSVKYSSAPPSDPRIEPQVLRYKAPPPPKPAPAAAAKPPAPPANIAELESRWRTLAAQVTAISPEELKSGSERARQQIQAYEAVRSELDRADPAGIPRRNGEMALMMQRVSPRTQ